MIILKGKLIAKTPFMIGSGSGTSSDCDVIRDGEGRVFIPGSSLAGVSRHYFDKDSPEIKGLIDEVFGLGDKESNILFYDAFLEGASYVSIRDSVRLHQKQAVKKAKFDYEIVEAGASFLFRLQVDEDKLGSGELLNLKKVSAEELALCILKHIADGFQKGEIRLGAKTSRGFGEFAFTEISVLRLDLHQALHMKTYIELDHFAGSREGQEGLPKWEVLESIQGLRNLLSFSSNYEILHRKLSLKTFLFIRDETTVELVKKGDESSKFVDAETLLDHKKNIVISGTAIAGAFRHHCRRILAKVGKREEDIVAFLNEAFGYEPPLDEKGELMPENEDKKSRSKVRFGSVSIHKDSLILLNRTRTAIDRVTGSALQTGALYTERAAYMRDGIENEIDLSIMIEKSFKEEEDLLLIHRLMEICLEDLEKGYLTLGGNTTIGAGVFTEWKGGDSGEKRICY